MSRVLFLFTQQETSHPLPQTTKKRTLNSRTVKKEPASPCLKKLNYL